jgi:hypothetical protein
MALEWLAVAEQHRRLTKEYRDKRGSWEAAAGRTR